MNKKYFYDSNKKTKKDLFEGNEVTLKNLNEKVMESLKGEQADVEAE